MFKFVVLLLCFAGVAVFIFKIFQRVIMLWTGKSKEEAANAIWEIWKRRTVYHLAEDNLFINNAWEIIRGVIGDARFDKLNLLSATQSVVWAGELSGLQYVAFTVPLRNRNEQMMVERLLRKKAEDFLAVHGYFATVLTCWMRNPKNEIPCIVIRYAENDDQKQVMMDIISRKNEQILRSFNPVKDEEVEDDTGFQP